LLKASMIGSSKTLGTFFLTPHQSVSLSFTCILRRSTRF